MKTTSETETKMRWDNAEPYVFPKEETTKREIATKSATEKDCENCPYIKLILEEVFKHVDKLDEILELNRDGRPTDTTVDNEVN